MIFFHVYDYMNANAMNQGFVRILVLKFICKVWYCWKGLELKNHPRPKGHKLGDLIPKINQNTAQEEWATLPWLSTYINELKYEQRKNGIYIVEFNHKWKK